MIQIIAGKKGKGKTKQLLDKVNAEVNEVHANIISQYLYLEHMFLYIFLKIAKLEDADITETIDKLDELGEKYNITFVLSISLDADDLPENAKSKVIVSL